MPPVSKGGGTTRQLARAGRVTSLRGGAGRSFGALSAMPEVIDTNRADREQPAFLYHRDHGSRHRADLKQPAISRTIADDRVVGPT
jgi:hypothetical protein